MLWLQIGFDFLPFLGILRNIIGWLVSAIQFIFLYLFGLIRAVFEFLWAGILIVVQFILRMLGHVGKFFTNLWERVIKRGLVKLLGLYATLRRKLVKILEPVLRILRRIREWIDRHILPVMLRYLNLIQRIRQVLVVFRILGFKWAKRLDQRLALTEGKIAQAFNLVRAKLNEIATIINLVMDPLQIIRRNPLWGVMAQAWDAIAKLITGMGLRGLLLGGPRVGGPLQPSGNFREIFKEAREGITNPNEDQREILAQIAETQADLHAEVF